MEEENKIEFSDNPEFNEWLNDNYIVEIEEFVFRASEVLYNIKYEYYLEALVRYNEDPKIAVDRILNKFPSPIAYYLDQAENNYQNDHHQLDLLKSCWESIIFFIYGLVVAEARHRKIPLKSLGIKWDKYWSDKVFDKLTIVENILDYTSKNKLTFGCAEIITIETLGLIKKLNQERNGFEHASAKTAAQQKVLYKELYPLVIDVLKKLIKLENVILFRYHELVVPLYPRCELFNGCSLDGKKDVVSINKNNYIEILEHFDSKLIFAKVNDESFCVAPFIHFSQELHETNAMICFYKKEKGGKYDFEVVSPSLKTL
jgi:hypothetical protein